MLVKALLFSGLFEETNFALQMHAEFPLLVFCIFTQTTIRGHQHYRYCKQIFPPSTMSDNKALVR